jgi:hypothetical protein
MLQAPIQYTTPINPLQSFAQGSAVGGMIGEAVQGFKGQQDAKTAFEAAQKKAAEDAAAAEKKRLDDEAALMALYEGKGTSKDFARVFTTFDAAKQKEISAAIAAKTSEQRTAMALEAGNIIASIKTGNGEVTQNLLKARAEALQAAGDTSGATMYMDLANRYINPETGKPDPVVSFQTIRALGSTMSAFEEGRKALTAIDELDSAPLNQDKTLAETEKLRADILINEERLAFERDKLQKELDAKSDPAANIDESARKIMNTSVEKSVSADLLANQADNLAVAFDSARPVGGWTGNAMEALKKAAGGQDKFTALKQEYAKLRNNEVLTKLPPGVASDKDIEIAMAAFPADNSNPDLISSFLRGVAKLQRYTSSVEKAKAEWVNQNGSLGPARADFSASGQEVKKGQSFNGFIDGISIPNVAGITPAPGGGASSGAPAQTFSVKAGEKIYSFPTEKAAKDFIDTLAAKGVKAVMQ